MDINGVKVTDETSEKQQERLVASQRTARGAWQRLWLRMQSITRPQDGWSWKGVVQ